MRTRRTSPGQDPGHTLCIRAETQRTFHKNLRIRYIRRDRAYWHEWNFRPLQNVWFSFKIKFFRILAILFSLCFVTLCPPYYWISWFWLGKMRSSRINLIDVLIGWEKCFVMHRKLPLYQQKKRALEEILDYILIVRQFDRSSQRWWLWMRFYAPAPSMGPPR